MGDFFAYLWLDSIKTRPMTPTEINLTLIELFGPDVQKLDPDSWQIETPKYRLLILLSEDQSWLRVLVPIVPAPTAEPFLEQILEANFDATQETRYALHQGILWGVFQYSSTGINAANLSAAIKRLTFLAEQGLTNYFDQLVESRIRQIIQAAKQQGHSLEATLQTLNRFYEEGVMGDLGQSGTAREETLATWRWQLERLWSEVESE